MDILLSSDSLSVGYGKKITVDDLSFEVRAGEIITLIGSNGAGKSTILKTIASLLPIISGSVYINNTDISAMTERDSSKVLSALFTQRLTAERMTCYEVAATGRYPYTGRLGILSAMDRKIVDEAMDMTSITHLADTDFSFISDGQRQIVMLARAIAQQPKVLVLDEPTSFLDINNKLRLLTLLRKLAKEKCIAIIQSLHELELAQRFSDKLLCIKNGKADRTGTPEEIFSGDYISELYGIHNGSFVSELGICEAEKTCGVPKIFVIGGNGKGIPVYRKLARQGIPFAAGIIYENDIDHPIAQALAAEVVSAKAFEPVGQADIERAIKIIEKCSTVICAKKTFGSYDNSNSVLLGFAEDRNIKIEYT